MDTPPQTAGPHGGETGPIQRVVCFLRERVAPVPGRLIAGGLYFLLVLPMGLLYKRLSSDNPFRPKGPSYWRPWRGSSDTLEKALRRY